LILIVRGKGGFWNYISVPKWDISTWPAETAATKVNQFDIPTFEWRVFACVLVLTVTLSVTKTGAKMEHNLFVFGNKEIRFS
jgi:hypothetical protein